MKNEGTILTAGMAEVSVKEIIALEKSVNDKDQTIGALREQIKNLESKIEDVKADAVAKQAMVIIQKGSGQKKSTSYRCTCGYYYDATYYHSCPSCSTRPSNIDDTKEYKNLDTVIEDIRKEQATKLGLDFADMDKKLNELNLEKTKLQNKLDFETKDLQEKLKQERKDKDKEIQDAKEKIRKHMTTLIDGLNDELEEVHEELKKVKKDKTDEQVEEARKQEIIDLKERIHELENAKEAVLNFGWFKRMIYNWLDVDGKAKVKAEENVIEKKDRVKEISNNYPNNKSFWNPSTTTTSSSSMWTSFDPWMF